MARSFFDAAWGMVALTRGLRVVYVTRRGTANAIGDETLAPVPTTSHGSHRLIVGSLLTSAKAERGDVGIYRRVCVGAE